MLQANRYEEYPKLKEMISRKEALTAARATPPYYLKVLPSYGCCVQSAVCVPALSWLLMQPEGLRQHSCLRPQAAHSITCT